MTETVSKRNLKRMFPGDHRMSLIIDKLYSGYKVFIVTQNNHGFAVGDAIRYAGTQFIKAQANSEDNAKTIGVVAKVYSSHKFTYMNEGVISSAQFIPGRSYYLSPSTPGLVAALEEWPAGSVKQLIGYCGPNGLELEIDFGSKVNTGNGEVPVGIVDGENTTFYLSGVPNPYTIRVYRNGIRQQPNVDFTFVGNKLDFTDDPANGFFPPQPNEEIMVFFDPFDVASEFIPGEVPAGIKNGENKTYTLAEIPDPARAWVYRNGQLLRLGIDYFIFGNTILFVLAPYSYEYILVDYFAALQPAGIYYNIIPAGDIDGVNTTFTLPFSPSAAIGFRNGKRGQEANEYTHNNDSIEYAIPPQPGEWHLFDLVV